MNWLHTFAYFVFVSTSHILAAPFDTGCRLEVDIDSLNIPLVWNEKGKIYPQYDNSQDRWFLNFKANETFNAACPDDENSFNHFKHTIENKLELKCLYGSQVKSSQGINFRNLQCTTALQEVVTRNGTCYNGYSNVNIHFPTGNPPYTLLTVCHHELIDETIFSQHELYGADLEHAEPVGNRPNFKEGGFYTQINADDCYKQAQQITTIAGLLGSRQLAEHYIQPSKNLFLARGHLTPSGDPIYSYEKKATYYFINATPQWQTINGGNFERLESAIRTLAGKLKATFTIWTGSYGIMKLNDFNNNPAEIWLGKDAHGNKRLPVAHLTWKVIHNQEDNSAVAVVHINNPWLTNVTSWITWNTLTDIVKGYTYCCDVASFKKAVPFAPDLGDLPLLD